VSAFFFFFQTLVSALNMLMIKIILKNIYTKPNINALGIQNLFFRFCLRVLRRGGGFVKKKKEKVERMESHESERLCGV